MINFIKIFTILIAIALIVIIIINICESAKRDFQLRDILNLFQKDQNQNKSKNNEVVVIDGKKRQDHNIFHRGPQLVPIAMPMYPPIPVPYPPLPLPPPPPPMMMHRFPPPMMMHQPIFRHIPAPVPEPILFPIHIEKEVHPPPQDFPRTVHLNAHSYGDIDDTDLNMEIDTNEHEDNSHDWRKSEWHKNYKYKEHKIQANYDNSKQNGNYDKFEELLKHLKDHEQIKDNELKKMDSDEIPSSSVKIKINSSKDSLPDEQMIDLFEDEWTFKDLDLWFVG